MDRNLNKQPLSKAQEKAKSFIEEHNVEKIISEMLNSLVHSRDPKPIIFMIKYLSNLVTESELEEYGIRVTGPAPQRIPIITYPKFETECDSLLKKYLTREIWANMKKKSTNLGGNIQMCVKSGVQYMDGKVGVMATDDEAYKTFGDLFGPIIKDLHPLFDHRVNYKFEELKSELIQETLLQQSLKIDKIQNFKIEVRRNFKGTQFTPLMTQESKLQVEKKVIDIFGDLYGRYQQIKNIDKETVEWLKSVGIDAQNQNKELEAAGINDDWPVGRGIFIQDNKDFVVLVNFEDHLKFILIPGQETSLGQPDDQISQTAFFQGINRTIKTLQIFEKLGYATDSYLGNLTVSPRNLGTAMKIECTLKSEKQDSLNRAFVKKLEEQNFIKIEEKDSQVIMKNCVTLAPNYNELFQLKDFLLQIGEVQRLLDP